MMKILFRSLLVLIGAVLLIVGLTYYYYFMAGGLEKVAREQVNAFLGEGSRVTVEIGDIRGDLITGVIIEDIVATYSDGLITFTMMSVEQAVARYDIANLLKRQYLFDGIFIDSARFEFHQDSTGKLLGFSTLSGRAADSNGTTAMLSLDELVISNSAVMLVKPNDTVSFDKVTVMAAVNAEAGAYAADLKRTSFVSNVPGLELTNLTGLVTIDEGMAVFKDVILLKDETRLEGSGLMSMEERTGELTVKADNFDIGELNSYTGSNLSGIVDFEGKLTYAAGKLVGEATVSGTFQRYDIESLWTQFQFADRRLTLDSLLGNVLGDCRIGGHGWVDFSDSPETYFLMADVASFDLQQLARNSFSSDLNGHIHLSGRSFRSNEMELTIVAEISESRFDVYPIHSASGEMVITARDITFGNDFRLSYYENEFLFEGLVDYDEELELHIDGNFPRLERWRGELFIEEPAGRAVASAELTGRTREPNIQGSLTSDSIWLYGAFSDSLSAEFAIDQFLTRRQGPIRIVSGGGHLWENSYDSLSMLLAVDSQIIHFDSARVFTTVASVLARGSVLTEEPMNIRVDSLRFQLYQQTFLNRGTVAVIMDERGFDFKQFILEDTASYLSVLGRLNFDETMNLRAHLNELPVTPWLALAERPLPLEGKLTADIGLKGAFDDPSLEMTAHVDSLVYDYIYVGETSLHAHYRDRIVQLDSLLIDSKPGTLVAVGTVSADLRLDRSIDERLPDKPIDLTISANESRFDIVMLLLPSVEDISGDIVAQFRLTGTPREPHLEGAATIRNASVKYLDLADVLYLDSATIRTQGNKIILTDVSPYVRDRRSNVPRHVLINGTLTVEALDRLYWDLELEIPRGFPFRYELDDIEGIFGPSTLYVRGYNPPTVSGDLTIMSMAYRVEFAEGTEGSPIMSALSGAQTWDLDLFVDIPSNYWIKNEDLDAEFAGEMNLIREDGRYRIIGSMESLRGRAYLFDKTFTLEPGGIATFPGEATPNPQLDFTMCTRVPGVRLDTLETPEALEICIVVTGTLANPDINPAPGSEFTREEILPLLVANYYSGDSARGVSDLDRRVASAIAGQLSQVGSRGIQRLVRVIGVETFEIDPGYSGNLDLRQTSVTAGGYLRDIPNLYVYGRSALSFEEVGFGAEYRFSRGVVIEGRRDEDELYHVNLKLHWEF